MKRRRTVTGPKGEQGLVITLVAVVLLFVVGAMAVLAIDVATFYTARSEAQLAADGAALAGARMLANSGMTSNPGNHDLVTDAESVARAVAKQVAEQNEIAGAQLTSDQVTVTFSNDNPVQGYNPQVSVVITRTDLPTFFARIWGRAQVTVTASATAEAYNPSGGVGNAETVPIAPTCVKPWLLPNLDPTISTVPRPPIINRNSGAIVNPGLLASSDLPLQTSCTSPSTCTPPASAWSYYPGTLADFPAPNTSSVDCPGSTGFNGYQRTVAGCVQTPISCNSTVNINSTSPPLYADMESAVDCLARTQLPNSNGADSLDTVGPPPPFQFLAGANNPVVQSGNTTAGRHILVSNSLVTVPVFDSTGWTTGTSVQIIGFVQLFLQPEGTPTGTTGGILTRVTNVAGCGIAALSGPPFVYGNGPSAVPVRLIAPAPSGP